VIREPAAEGDAPTTSSPVARDLPPDLAVYPLLRALAERIPGAPAILGLDRPLLTFARLYDHVEATCQVLNSMGVGRNDRVALLLPDGPEMAVAFLAVVSAATAVPLNPASTGDECALALADLDAKAVLVQAGTASSIREAARARGVPTVELHPAPEAAGLFALTGGSGMATRHGGFAHPDDVALLLHTSGSQGRPKRIPLTHINICSTALRNGVAMELTGADRCLSIMPLFHIHGLVVVALSAVLAGSSVVCTPGFQVERFFEWLDRFRPTWYSAIPPIHQAVLAAVPAHREVIARRPLRFIRTGSAPLPPQAREELERVFDAPVINTYGLTESPSIAIMPLPPRPRKPGSVGVAGCSEIGILDEEGRPLPRGATGEIAVRGPNVMLGYENDPEANAIAFINGWLRTGDQGYLDPDGYLFITGRLSEFINRGGEKVSPGEVDDVLGGHPAVAQAVTFGVPHPTLGEDVAAAVVLRAGMSVNESELRAFVAARLAHVKVPRRILTVRELPKGATGKVQRRTLAEHFGLLAAVPAVAGTTPPRTQTEAAVAAIWAHVLSLERVGVEDDFFALGGDSISAALILSRLREALGVELPRHSLFETPTVAGLSEAVEAARSAAPAPEAPPLRPASRESHLPLSFAQERFWVLDRFTPGNPAYNAASAFRISGPLNVPALARSLQTVVDRHEALRTIFALRDGMPVQVISPALSVELPLIDLRHLPHLQGEDRARRLMAEEACRPFDLSRGPLLRAALIRLGEQEHLLTLTQHHVISDAWSMGILQRELGAVYGATLAGEPVSLPTLPVQYADFAVWQRELLRGTAGEAQLAYWKRQLAGTLPRVELPTDRPRPPTQTFRGGEHDLVLSRALSQSLEDLARNEGVSRFMLLLAVFQLLVHRLTGEEDILVGAPVAGRDRAELEGLVGCFINILVLRASLAGNPTFRNLLARVREVALGAYTNQDLPLERLLQELHPERDPSRPPLVQVLLNMQTVPDTPLSLMGLAVEELPPPAAHALFDVTLYCREVAEGIALRLAYNTDLFEAARMAEMLGQFQLLLEQIVARPDARLADFSLVTPAARAVLPDPCAPLPDIWQGSVHTQFARQAQRRPEQIALVAEGRRWRYGELEARSNQLAQALRAAGVGPEDIVAIYACRSAALVWAVLGALKAGAAFLILDPAYPGARLRACVEQARPRAWITLDGAGALPPELHAAVNGSPCLWRLGPGMEASAGAGTAGDPLEAYPARDPEVEIGPDSLACLTFTSGSTGEPKGVLGRHGALSYFLPWQAASFGFGAADRFSLLSGLAHDPLQRDIFTPLWVGGTLCVPDPERIGAPGWLAAWMRREQITVTNLTPAMLQLVTEGAGVLGEGFRLDALRHAFIVGDVLTRRDVARLRRLAPGSTVVNLYGTTETQRALAHFVVPAEEMAAEKEVVPLGRGIPGMQLLLLTTAGHLAGVGEPGEIHVRSPHLARGYLGDEALTRERFLLNPFTAVAGDRLYRTGDLGRYRLDGTVEFLGRTDMQVKLRGFRIELGEAEAALGRHPEVREAVVVLREEARGSRCLVAYVVPAAAPSPNPAELRRFLRERLPDYMVPAAFVPLPSLPLSPTGKVDRRALHSPEATREAAGHARVAPRNVLEEDLAQVWEEVLEVRPVGIRDNFFDLGGYSLLAVRVFAEIARRHGRSLPLAAIFRAPTVEQLAVLLREDGWVPSSALVPLQSRGNQPPLFCVHQHTGHLFCYQHLARHLGANQPVYGLIPRGLDGREQPLARLEAMAETYIQEIRRLQPAGPYHLAGYCFGGMVAFEMARQFVAQGEGVGLVALIESVGGGPAAWAQRRRLTVRLARRFAYERAQLAPLSAAAKLSYLGEKATALVRELPGKILTRLQEHGGSQTYLNHAIRRVEAAHRNAGRHYEPSAYPGRVVLFRPARPSARHHGDPLWGWDRLALGGVEICEIPATRPTIVDEPDVHILAAELRKRLASEPLAPSTL